MKEYYVLEVDRQTSKKYLKKVKGYEVDEYCYVYLEQNSWHPLTKWKVIHKNTGLVVTSGKTKTHALEDYKIRYDAMLLRLKHKELKPYFELFEQLRKEQEQCQKEEAKQHD